MIGESKMDQQTKSSQFIVPDFDFGLEGFKQQLKQPTRQSPKRRTSSSKSNLQRRQTFEKKERTHTSRTFKISFEEKLSDGIACLNTCLHRKNKRKRSERLHREKHIQCSKNLGI